MRTNKRNRKYRPEPVPEQWIGIRKGWLRTCRSIGEALVPLPEEALSTHALIIGATGSGKTNFIHHLIAQDLERGHSVVLLDARGDLAAAAIEIAARVGIKPSRVKFFDLREKLRPFGFNPLH